MAHLTDRGGDRAQLLIVSAFALGVLFVALALILNSAIFTENLASRGETTGGEQVLQTQESINRGIGRVLTYENENVSGAGVPHSTIESRIRAGVENYTRAMTRRQALAGGTATVQVSDQTDGTLIRQTNASRAFTDEGDSDDWTLATDVAQTRAFELNVTRSELEPCTRFGDCYNLVVSDLTNDWTLSINDSSGVTVAVRTGGTTAVCDPVAADHVVVDITGGTVGGERCAALNFSQRPSAPYRIRHENGNQIGGTYSLVVDNGTSLLTLSSPYGSDPATDDPTATPALYALNLSYDYQSADVNYSTAIRVAPGEHDD